MVRLIPYGCTKLRISEFPWYEEEQKQQEEVFFQVLILNWRERRMEISRSEEKDMDMVSE